ncbi:uncharacterized protein BP01DRAFT_105543 [Aspergillus saccharolyticus JOP 1030-1]|uniref:Condensation domain-containing protein n=1 Tax=Aspergillus saccharolyticus JOP 1030-1 TaxID=1450539 RepID=A0A318Z7B6_9EURO|nr:hypothetical protein BP01DRAFT_105543 [Aspergillus saccharolyticus JOP 1030-1]PYH43221.1 hypothetical protein BP01DRAFT_105543 [Aspergillus saccharolyticus JOP 1030-1]
MSWSQVSERRWERPANGMEGFFAVMENTSSALCEGRRQFIIISRLKVDLQLPAAEVEEALRYAWKQLRYEQPQIAVATEGDHKVYEVPDEAALQSWLERTFIVSDALDSEAIGKEAPPIAQPTLYYLPQASPAQLVLRASHSVIDGVGTLWLWHTYLTALTHPNPTLVFGDEAQRLPPSLEKALGHPDVLAADTIAKGVQIVGEAVSQMPGIGPVNKIGTVPAGPTQRRELELPPQTTEAIVQACRRNGYSVTAAVHAAFALTVVKHADPAQPAAKYVTVNNFNLRDHLPAPYNSSRYAAAVYYSIWPLILDPPTSFTEAVRAIDAQYKGVFKDSPENVALCGAVTSGLREIVKSPEFWAAPPARDALVSSLGVIERYLEQSYASDAGDRQRGVVVEDFKLGTEIVLGHSMFFLYTFRNRLRVVFSFNEAYEAEESVQSYLEDVQKILLEELVA